MAALDLQKHKNKKMTPEEYRSNLYDKINKLMTVLAESIGKIENAMEKPEADVERLSKIRNNLMNTFEILGRAKVTLVTGKTSAIPSGIREYTEMTTVEEYRKFQKMKPITTEEIADVDWKDLIDKLKDV